MQRVLAVALFAAGAWVAVLPTKVTLPAEKGAYPVMEVRYEVERLATNQLTGPSVKDTYHFRYVDAAHWSLDLVATTGDPKVVGSFQEADGDEERSGKRGGGAASETTAQPGVLPPAVSPAGQEALQANKAAVRKKGPKYLGRPTVQYETQEQVNCTGKFAECGPSAPANMQFLKSGVVPVRSVWVYDEATGLPLQTSQRYADFVVNSYRVKSLRFPSS